MIRVALYQPKIPQNTGNVIRLCANVGAELHVIHPLGFLWDDKKLQRAGLDYHGLTKVIQHDSFIEFMKNTSDYRHFICTTKGSNSVYSKEYTENDIFIFGSEDGGIRDEDQEKIDKSRWVRLPMQKNSRSLNLANTVAIVAYEALRQQSFIGLN